MFPQEVHDMYADKGLHVSFTEYGSIAADVNKSAAENLDGKNSDKDLVESWINKYLHYQRQFEIITKG
ncbi:hypothetical protein [Photorhabdus bodei]|uniref:Uncharacterized protein n=2 Tax=Photorhabdus TaxID=29487 RepID=A0AAW6BSM0_9GAMM|nr:hypothetical protein [Photorhabdus bodei]MDB6374667.1 hypothetical protein [Photorhabdus bodei]